MLCVASFMLFLLFIFFICVEDFVIHVYLFVFAKWFILWIRSIAVYAFTNTHAVESKVDDNLWNCLIPCRDSESQINEICVLGIITFFSLFIPRIPEVFWERKKQHFWVVLKYCDYGKIKFKNQLNHSQKIYLKDSLECLPFSVWYFLDFVFCFFR